MGLTSPQTMIDPLKTDMAFADMPVNITAMTVERQVALGHGDRPALRWIDGRLNRHDFTYAQLAEAASRTARMLLDAGIGPGDVVGVLLPKTPELFWVALATWKIGAVFCPLLASFGPAPIAARLSVGRAKILITTPLLYAQSVAPHRKQLEGLLSVLYVTSSASPATSDGMALDFAALMSLPAPVPVETHPSVGSTPAFLHFTSGTTGSPKGTLHGHGAALAHLHSARHLFDLDATDVFWCTAEPGWVPLTAYGIIAPLAVGCLTIMDSQDFAIHRWYSILKEDRVTVWYTTSDSIRMMMRHGAALARTYGTFALRFAATGGGPLHTEAVAWSKRALGIVLISSWWQSETGAILIANHPETPKPGSLGHPLPGVEIAVVKRTPNGFQTIQGQTKVGELAIKSKLPSMFIGYVGDDQRYRDSFVDGWYLTGDHVRRDRDDFLWFAGRSDDLIKFQGHMIGPFELENTLLDHPAVAETAVIGKPDTLSGQCPVAFVSLNPGFEAGESLRQELLDFARTQLGSPAPQDIHFIEVIPKTATGCIMRRSLREHLSTLDPELMDQTPFACAFMDRF